jgi:hypothetical protein
MARTLLAALSSILILGASVAMAEDGAETSTVDDLNVTGSGDTLSVSGSASFAGTEPFLVGDFGQPSTVGDAGRDLGAEIEEVLIGQPDAGNEDLAFTYRMKDIEFSQIPEWIQYYWDFSIRQANGDTNLFSIGGKASRATTGGAPSFALNGNCEQTENLIQCENFGDVPGQLDLDAGTVTVTIPADLLRRRGTVLEGAQVGEASMRGGIAAQPSQVAVNMFAFQYNVFHDNDYPIATKVVSLLVTDEAGELIASQDVATSDGTFSATFTDLAPGTYAVSAVPCFGACGDDRTAVVDL